MLSSDLPRQAGFNRLHGCCRNPENTRWLNPSTSKNRAFARPELRTATHHNDTTVCGSEYNWYCRGNLWLKLFLFLESLSNESPPTLFHPDSSLSNSSYDGCLFVEKFLSYLQHPPPQSLPGRMSPRPAPWCWAKAPSPSFAFCLLFFFFKEIDFI